MRNRIIYDCYIGPPVFGVYTAEDVMQRRAVYLEQLKNLLGFRTYYPVVESEGFVFYEVGHFMELLFQGSPEAFTMLYMDEDYVEQSSHEIRILKDSRDELISEALPKSLLQYCEDKREAMLSGISYFSDEKSVKKLGYDKDIAYICNLYLRLAKDTLLTKKFKVTRKDSQILEAIKEGRFSIRTIEKEFDEQVEEVKELLSRGLLPREASKDLMNELLFKIRNIEDIQEVQRITS